MAVAFFGCSTRWVKALANGQNAGDAVKCGAGHGTVKRGKKPGLRQGTKA
jgi:hypothetical protein